MNKWVNMADRLKRVQDAREDFLMRDFVDRSIIGPMLLDRIAADLCAIGETGVASTLQPMSPTADDRYID